MEIEKQTKTRKEIIFDKIKEVKQAKRASDIYNVINWSEEMKKKDEPIYEDDYEKLQFFAMKTLLEIIEKAPQAKNWSNNMKEYVNVHLAHLRKINDQILNNLEDEYLAAQKAGEIFKLKELEEKMNENKLFNMRLINDYQKINKKQAA